MSDNSTFKVFGSNALRTVLLDCLPAFERAHGVTADVEFSATHHTLQSLRGGATADVIIATASAIDTLADEGKILQGTRIDLAVAGIGACVRAGAPRPDISTVAALKRTLLEAQSVTHSQSGQSGVHMAKVIMQLGIADTIRKKVTINASGLVGELVARGEVELGFQQVSELLAVKGIDLIGELPAEVQLHSRFAAGIGAATQQRDAAQALIQALCTPHAHGVMRAAGLTPI
ncbi:MAG: substrate-binding domain-containing protein [Burkholderiales bacterium]